jgi:hypothetical protein
VLLADVTDRELLSPLVDSALPLVQVSEADDPMAIAKRLTAVIAPLLK